jgi:hypothetical protein
MFYRNELKRVLRNRSNAVVLVFVAPAAGIWMDDGK